MLVHRVVIKSDEWVRQGRGGCKPDLFSYTMNGRSLVSQSGSVGVCDAWTLGKSQKVADWGFWETFPNPPDGPRAVLWMGPWLSDNTRKNSRLLQVGKRNDVAIGLTSSGDGQAPSIIYIGKNNIGIVLLNECH
jgi:hypothetical protein